MTGLAAFLQTYGGWAIAAITLIALAHIYKTTSDLLEKRHSEFVSILKEASHALLSASTSITKMTSMLDRIESSMKKDEELVKEIKKIMEHCKHNQP